MRRIAIIGSGATALAVLGVASTVPEARVALIRPGKHLIPHRVAEAGSPRDRDAFAETIRALRGDLGLRFPPPKTQFGELPDTAEVYGWGRIWKSNLHGGLTQFWGGAMVPFTDRELGGWPLRRCDLEVEYSTIAKRVGITGAADGLCAYFDDKFAQRAPPRSNCADRVVDRPAGLQQTRCV